MQMFTNHLNTQKIIRNTHNKTNSADVKNRAADLRRYAL